MDFEEIVFWFEGGKFHYNIWFEWIMFGDVRTYAAKFVEAANNQTVYGFDSRGNWYKLTLRDTDLLRPEYSVIQPRAVPPETLLALTLLGIPYE